MEEMQVTVDDEHVLISFNGGVLVRAGEAIALEPYQALQLAQYLEEAVEAMEDDDYGD
jgi:hypothetical protein